MSNRSFVRCDLCCQKPATIRRWEADSEVRKLCYHCDLQRKNSVEPRKEIIPYEEMISESSQKLSNQLPHAYPLNRTPIKVDDHYQRPTSSQPQIYTSQKQPFKPETDALSYSTLKERPQNNMRYDQLNSSISRSDTKATDIKFRIKLQEQENTIAMLRNHLENIEHVHRENQLRMRNELQQNEEQLYQQGEKYNMEIQRIKVEQETRINHYLIQLESEKQRREVIEQKLDTLRYDVDLIIDRKSHESKVMELQVQITNLRSENERQKMEKEKIIYDCDEQIAKHRQQQQEEADKIISKVKAENNNAVKELTEKLIKQAEQYHQGQLQNQQLQVSISEVNLMWQQKLQNAESQIDNLKNQLKEEHDKADKLKRENVNLHQELNIIQKEQELVLKEKHVADKKINQIHAQNQKLERFIYGGKKSKRL